MAQFRYLEGGLIYALDQAWRLELCALFGQKKPYLLFYSVGMRPTSTRLVPSSTNVSTFPSRLGAIKRVPLERLSSVIPQSPCKTSPERLIDLPNWPPFTDTFEVAIKLMLEEFGIKRPWPLA